MRRVLMGLAAICVVVASCGGVSAPPTPKSAPLIERGMNLYVSNDPSVDTPAKLNTRLNEIFAYLEGLNVNAVALYFPVFVNGPTGSTVSTGAKTPSPAMMQQIIKFAHGRALKVKLRPSIDPNNLQGSWHGALQPANRKQWFSSYTTTLLPFASLARETGVEEFQIGNELDTLEGDPNWDAVLDTLRSVYRRSLTYTVHWEVLDNRTAQPPTEVYGLSAYPPLNLTDQATQEEVTTAWNAWLDKVGAGYNLRRIVLDEVGISGAKGMYREPWTWGDAPELEPNQSVQAMWFTAACEATKQHNMPGLYWWKLDLFRSPSQKFADGENPDQFVGRVGENAIRNCFAA